MQQLVADDEAVCDLLLEGCVFCCGSPRLMVPFLCCAKGPAAVLSAFIEALNTGPMAAGSSCQPQA
jgi:hypothetical protein